MNDRRNLIEIWKAKQVQNRLDDEGHWVTTESGAHVHINGEGEPDKGNSEVIKAMTGAKKSFTRMSKEYIKKAETMSAKAKANPYNLTYKKSVDEYTKLAKAAEKIEERGELPKKSTGYEAVAAVCSLNEGDTINVTSPNYLSGTYKLEKKYIPSIGKTALIWHSKERNHSFSPDPATVISELSRAEVEIED